MVFWRTVSVAINCFYFIYLSEKTSIAQNLLTQIETILLKKRDLRVSMCRISNSYCLSRSSFCVISSCPNSDFIFRALVSLTSSAPVLSILSLSSQSSFILFFLSSVFSPTSSNILFCLYPFSTSIVSFLFNLSFFSILSSHSCVFSSVQPDTPDTI